MEGFSSIERVVGDVSDEVKQGALEISDHKFSHQEQFGKLIKAEREKTQEELYMTNLAQESLDELRFKYGLDPIYVPQENVHVIKNGQLEEEGYIEKAGMFNAQSQAIAIEEVPLKMEFMTHVVHEMAHFKSYAALQIPENSDQIGKYRLGLNIISRKYDTSYFQSLNEGLTEEIARRICIQHFIEDPFFAEEVSRAKEIFRKNHNVVGKKTKQPIIDRDTYYAEDPVKLPDGGFSMDKKTFTYKEERKALNMLIDALFMENQNKFQNRTQVYEEFEKAMFSGNVLTIGKLVDQTFGEGAFRKIGEATRENIVEIVEGIVTK